MSYVASFETALWLDEEWEGQRGRDADEAADIA